MASDTVCILVGFGMNALKVAGVVAGILAGVGIALSWPLVWILPLMLASVATSSVYVTAEGEEHEQ